MAICVNDAEVNRMTRENWPRAVKEWAATAFHVVGTLGIVIVVSVYLFRGGQSNVQERWKKIVAFQPRTGLTMSAVESQLGVADCVTGDGTKVIYKYSPFTWHHGNFPKYEYRLHLTFQGDGKGDGKLIAWIRAAAPNDPPI